MRCISAWKGKCHTKDIINALLSAPDYPSPANMFLIVILTEGCSACAYLEKLKAPSPSEFHVFFVHFQHSQLAYMTSKNFKTWENKCHILKSSLPSSSGSLNSSSCCWRCWISSSSCSRSPLLKQILTRGQYFGKPFPPRPNAANFIHCLLMFKYITDNTLLCKHTSLRVIIVLQLCP